MLQPPFHNIQSLVVAFCAVLMHVVSCHCFYHFAIQQCASFTSIMEKLTNTRHIACQATSEKWKSNFLSSGAA